MKYKTVEEWVENMSKHSCQTKELRSDDEITTPAVNYTCKCGERFTLGVAHLPEMNPEYKYRDLLKTAKGREQLATLLNQER